MTVSTNEMMSPSLKAFFVALESCLWILKKVMLVMVIMFFCSGVFWVEEGSLAIRLRFGKICGQDGHQIFTPGGPYFGFPDPIDKRLVIPTTIQTVTLADSFWNKTKLYSSKMPTASQSQVTSALLTGDKNIVYGKWTITFVVSYNSESSQGLLNPLLFFKNIGSIESACEIVTLLAEKTIVHVTAQTSVDDYVRGKENHHIIQQMIQKDLDQLETGLRICSVSQQAYDVPHHLNYEFQAVNRAESQKALKIEEAQRYRAMILNQSAGHQAQKIIQIIQKMAQTSDPNEKSTLDKNLYELFVSDALGGIAAEHIHAAKVYHTKTLESIQAAIDRFQRLLIQDQKNSTILRHRMLQDCLETIFSKNNKRIVIPPLKEGQLYLDLSNESLK